MAIGVAMIVAIDLANGSAERAFNLGAETVAGRATHQIVGGPTGLDEAVYTRLRRGGLPCQRAHRGELRGRAAVGRAAHAPPGRGPVCRVTFPQLPGQR
ncbi:MAG: hypothetical protein R2854_02045 [Caldilineaceae bacterium]